MRRVRHRAVKASDCCCSERVRRRVQTVTDLGQFARCEVNALLLGVRTLLLAVSTLSKRLQLGGHRVDRPSEVGQLGSDQRGIPLFRSHCCRILRRGVNNSTGGPSRKSRNARAWAGPDREQPLRAAPQALEIRLDPRMAQDPRTHRRTRRTPLHTHRARPTCSRFTTSTAVPRRGFHCLDGRPLCRSCNSRRGSKLSPGKESQAQTDWPHGLELCSPQLRCLACQKGASAYFGASAGILAAGPVETIIHLSL
jgi:hypothetical protein